MQVREKDYPESNTKSILILKLLLQMDNLWLIYHTTVSECGDPGTGWLIGPLPHLCSRQKERIQSLQRKDKLCGILRCITNKCINASKYSVSYVKIE